MRVMSHAHIIKLLRDNKTKEVKEETPRGEVSNISMTEQRVDVSKE